MNFGDHELEQVWNVSVVLLDLSGDKSVAMHARNERATTARGKQPTRKEATATTTEEAWRHK